jgi:hypothetical protein
LLSAAAFAWLFVASGVTTQLALAQQPAPVRMTGTIASIDGSTLVVKPAQGADATVKIADNVQVFGAERVKITDVKIGDYIAVGAMPQPDGSQKAIQVTVFAESQRGTGEGFRPWDRPGTTMTNATVDTTVSGVDGQVVTVKYKDGDKKIIVGPDAEVRRYVQSDKSELKAGARIALPRVEKAPDGSLQTARIYVGRGDVSP